MPFKPLKKTILFLTAAFILFSGILAFLNFEGIPGRAALRDILTGRLVRADLIPAGPLELRRSSAVYVLGGSQFCLEQRFKAASDLYKRGLARKILIYSKDGVTEYSHALKRNLTYNEWSTLKLVEYGVRKEDIEPVSVKQGLFGTYSEARGVSGFARRGGYRNLILVSSSYHTERVWVSFSMFKDVDLNLYIFKSPDGTDLEGLLYEYFKLFVYENFLAA